jgi:hypothetical protein
MLPGEDKFGPLRSLPPALRDYLDEQTARHAARLDLHLGEGPPDARVRRRWHEVGWRGAPTLAARYQDAGVEAAVAFLTYRRGFDPSVVTKVLDDPTSVRSQALVESRRLGYTIRQLELGQHALVTDDLPYERFEPARLVKPLLTPVPMRDWRAERWAWLLGEHEEPVAVGYARTPDAPDVDVVLRGLVAGVEAIRPKRRRRRAMNVARAR